MEYERYQYDNSYTAKHDHIRFRLYIFMFVRQKKRKLVREMYNKFAKSA